MEFGQGAQAPFPSQTPALWQSCFEGSLFLLEQRHLGSEPLEGNIVASAGGRVPVAKQLLHRPPEERPSLQTLLEHTPSVQKPLWHWLAAVHWLR